MEQHAGIDVSLELSSVCIMDASGSIVREAVNGTLNLTQACRYRHFEPDPPASSVCPRSREQCGQMLSCLSFALLGRARMPARRLSLSR